MLLVQTMYANYTLRPQRPILLLSLSSVEEPRLDIGSVSVKLQSDESLYFA